MPKFKNGIYFVSVVDKKLRHEETGEDFSDQVEDFNVFNILGVEVTGDIVEFVNIYDMSGFIRYPLMAGDIIPTKDVIKK